MADQKIMIVNDNTDIAELFAAGLENAGFQTNVFNDAPSAIEKIRSKPDQFLLVLTDHSSQQNTDFPKQVKGINARIKVVLASGFAFYDAELSESGYDKILQIPVTMSRLISIVKEVLSFN